MSEASSPERIGRFEIVRLLQEAGMGRLYVARHPTLRKEVVLKTLTNRSRRHGSQAVARLRREAEILARLDHAGICPVLDFVEEQGEQYVVLPLLDGEDLSVRIARAASRRQKGASLEQSWRELVGTAERDPLRAIVHFMEELARAVHAAHECSVIHRDLKPSNVMVRGDGRPVVLDFGVALDRGESDQPPITEGHSTPGTLYYMPPEQLRGERDKIGPPSDVYALGAVLYEVLTLRRAIGATDTNAAIAQILGGFISTPRRVVAEIPRDLEAVCLKALERDPARRYPTALALAEELARVREGRPTLARPLTPVTRLSRWARRSPLLAAAAGAVLVAAVVTGFAVAQASESEKHLTQTVDRQTRDVALVGKVVLGGRKKVVLSPEEETQLEQVIPDAGTRLRAFSGDLTPEEFEQLLLRMRDNYRGADGMPVTLIGPRGAILGAHARFAFRIDELSHPGFELAVELAAAEARIIARVTAKKVGEEFAVEVPADFPLVEGEEYDWTVKPGPGEESFGSAPRYVRFRIVAPATYERVVGGLPKTGDAALDATLRAAACLSLDLAGEALEELGKSPAPQQPELARLQTLLAAQAHALLGQDEEVERDREKLFPAK